MQRSKTKATESFIILKLNQNKATETHMEEKVKPIIFRFSPMTISELPCGKLTALLLTKTYISLPKSFKRRALTA